MLCAVCSLLLPQKQKQKQKQNQNRNKNRKNTEKNNRQSSETSKTSLTLTYRAFCNQIRLISHSPPSCICISGPGCMCICICSWSWASAGAGLEHHHQQQQWQWRQQNNSNSKQLRAKRMATEWPEWTDRRTDSRRKWVRGPHFRSGVRTLSEPPAPPAPPPILIHNTHPVPPSARVAKSVAWHRWQWQSRPDASNQILFYFAPSFRISNFDCQRVCVAVYFIFFVFFCSSFNLAFVCALWRNAKYLSGDGGNGNHRLQCEQREA